MLSSLSIYGIGVIEEAHLEFGPGFTALTGETGAGKTMVVTGLSLLMGRRLDTRRAGISSTVEGRIHAAEGTELEHKLDELGADVDDGEVLVVRRVTKDGRSRAHIGGVPVPVGRLLDVVGSEITIHGQSDQQRLKDPEAQREALDSVLSPEALSQRDTHARLFRERVALRREEQQLEKRLENREARKVELESILSAIEDAHTYEGEDEELKHEIEQLSTAADQAEASERALMAIAGDEHVSVLSTIDQGLDALSQLRTEAFDEVTRRLIALRDEASEIARELSLVRDDSLASPGRLAEAQERLHALSTLVRDVGPRVGGAASVAELMAASRGAVEDLEDLEKAEERLNEICARRAGIDTELEAAASALTEFRREAAERLAQAIDAELEGLEMPGASARISIAEQASGPHGRDLVSIELRPHPGADFIPIATGASGGELSRVMLALEVAIASLSNSLSRGTNPVFIFDEIDAGIGGRAARAVGERLARLAQSAQVIVVTHLPQVASWAGCHLRIVKDVGLESERTVSRVERLTDEARVEELARMLAGDVSETAIEHARELVDKSVLRGSA